MGEYFAIVSTCAFFLHLLTFHIKKLNDEILVSLNLSLEGENKNILWGAQLGWPTAAKFLENGNLIQINLKDSNCAISLVQWHCLASQKYGLTGVAEPLGYWFSHWAEIITIKEIFRILIANTCLINLIFDFLTSPLQQSKSSGDKLSLIAWLRLMSSSKPL